MHFFEITCWINSILYILNFILAINLIYRNRHIIIFEIFLFLFPRRIVLLSCTYFMFHLFPLKRELINSMFIFNRQVVQTDLSDCFRYRYSITSRKDLRYPFADERNGKNPSEINCAYDRDPLIKFCQLALRSLKHVPEWNDEVFRNRA